MFKLNYIRRYYWVSQKSIEQIATLVPYPIVFKLESIEKTINELVKISPTLTFSNNQIIIKELEKLNESVNQIKQICKKNST